MLEKLSIDLDEDEDSLLPMPALVGNEEPEETIAERVELNPPKRKMKEQD